MSQRAENGAGRSSRSSTSSSARGHGNSASGGRVGRGWPGQSSRGSHVKPQGYGRPTDSQAEGPPGRSPEGGPHGHANNNSHVPSPFSSPGPAAPANGTSRSTPQQHRLGPPTVSESYGGNAIMFGSLDLNEVVLSNGQLGSPIVQGPGVGNPHWAAPHGQPPISQSHAIPYSNGPSGPYSNSPVQGPPGLPHGPVSGPQGNVAVPPVTLPAPGPQQHANPSKPNTMRAQYMSQQGGYGGQPVYAQPPGLQPQQQTQYYQPYVAAGYGPQMVGTPSTYAGPGAQHPQGPPAGGVPYEGPRKSSKLKIVDPVTGKEVLPDQRRGSERSASSTPSAGSASMAPPVYNHSTPLGPGSHMGGGPPPSTVISDMHQNQYQNQFGQQLPMRHGPRPPGIPQGRHTMPPQALGGYPMQAHANPNLPVYGNPPSETIIQELARGGQGRRPQQGQAPGPVPYPTTDPNYGKPGGPYPHPGMMQGVPNAQPAVQHVFLGAQQQMRGLPPIPYRTSQGPPAQYERGAMTTPEVRQGDPHHKGPQASTGRGRAGKTAHQGGRGAAPSQNLSIHVPVNLDVKPRHTSGGAGRSLQLGVPPSQAREKKDKEEKATQGVVVGGPPADAKPQVEDKAKAAPETAGAPQSPAADLAPAGTEEQADSKDPAPKAPAEAADAGQLLAPESPPAEAKPELGDQPSEKAAERQAIPAENAAPEQTVVEPEQQPQAAEAKSAADTAEAADGLATGTAPAEDVAADVKEATPAAEAADKAAAEEKQQADAQAAKEKEEAEAKEAADKVAAEEAAAEAKRQAEAAELKAAAEAAEAAEKLAKEEAAAESKRQAAKLKEETEAKEAAEKAAAEEKRQAEAQAAKAKEEANAKVKEEAAAKVKAEAEAAERLAAEKEAAEREAEAQAAALQAAADAAEAELKAEEERAAKAKEEAERATAGATKEESPHKQDAKEGATAAAASSAKDEPDKEGEGKPAEPAGLPTPPSSKGGEPTANEETATVGAESNGQAPRELVSHAVPLAAEDDDTDDGGPPGKAHHVGSKAKRRAALAKAENRPVHGDLLDAFTEAPKVTAQAVSAPAPDAGPSTPSSKGAAAPSPVELGDRVEDDWENAASEIPTPGANRTAQAAAASSGGPDSSGRLTYTKDFLMLFKDKCPMRPAGLHDKALGDLDVGATGGREPPGARAGPQFDRGMGPRGAGPPMPGRGGPPVEDQWKRIPPMPVHAVPVQGRGGMRGMMGAPGGRMGPAAPGRGGLDGDQWKRATPLPPAPGMPGGGPAAPRLHKAAERFVLGRVQGDDPEEAKRQKEIKGHLNKITPEKYERIRDQIIAVDFSNPGTLRGLIDQVFDKALGEPTFCEIYAQLCFDLSQKLPEFPAIPPNEETGDPGREKVTFRRELLNKCQIEFEEGAAAILAVARREKAEAEAQLEEDKEEGEINVEDAKAKKLVEHKAAEAERKGRMRALGNIQFIGQLYKQRMLIEKIMHNCVTSLLHEHENPKAEDIECLCKLLTTIGLQLDTVKARAHMDVYFKRIREMSANPKLESRHRFMLRDLMDMRHSKWQVRRKVEGPKTIDEIHRDAAEEAKQQAARASAPPDRRDRDRDRRVPLDARLPMRGERPRFDTVDGPIRAMARAPSQEFGASLRPGGAGGGFAQVSLRPGAGPSAGRPAAAPRAGSPPKDDAASSEASVSSVSRMSEMDMKHELAALLTEFLSARDQQAVDDRIVELVEKRADFSFVVTTLFSNAITTKGLDAEKVDAFVKMMTQLGSAKDSPAPRDDLGKGLITTVRQHLTGFLEDNPRHACRMIGEVAGAWIAADIVTLEQVATATLEGGPVDDPDDEPELKGSGRAIDFMCTVLKQVAMGCGSEGVAALWKATGHKLEEFVAEVDLDTAADIVKKQATDFGLEALL